MLRHTFVQEPGMLAINYNVGSQAIGQHLVPAPVIPWPANYTFSDYFLGYATNDAFWLLRCVILLTKQIIGYTAYAGAGRGGLQWKLVATRSTGSFRRILAHSKYVL